MKNDILICTLIGIFVGFLVSMIINRFDKKKSHDEPIGTIHVNLSNPEEEFFRCTVDDNFIKTIYGPNAKPTVTFVVVID